MEKFSSKDKSRVPANVFSRLWKIPKQTDFHQKTIPVFSEAAISY